MQHWHDGKSLITYARSIGPLPSLLLGSKWLQWLVFDIDLKNVRIVTVLAYLFLRVHQAASAAWNMGEWDQMAEYVSRLDDGDETRLRSLGNTAASGDGSSSGTFYRAVLLVRKGKVLLIGDLYFMLSCTCVQPLHHFQGVVDASVSVPV